MPTTLLEPFVLDPGTSSERIRKVYAQVEEVVGAWPTTHTWGLPHGLIAPPRETFSGAMAWDAARKRIVLFGGDTPGARLADTWEWDGAFWARRTPTTSPPARGGHMMAFDSDRFGNGRRQHGCGRQGPAKPGRRLPSEAHRTR